MTYTSIILFNLDVVFRFIFLLFVLVFFECFGAYEFNNSNLGGSADTETIAFIEDLKHAPNLILHGMVPSEILAKELRRMDAFLICYDVKKDQSKGTNYHKVMEYLAYGRPIASNFVSRYSTDKENFIMPMAITSSFDSSYFQGMLDKLPQWNSNARMIQDYSELLRFIIEKL